MSDLHRRRGQLEAFTASARVLAPSIHDSPKPEPWHSEAWGFRDTVGELRFAESWLANSLSRCRLVAAKRPQPGEEPEPLENGPAFDLIAQLAGGVGGQSDLLRMFAPFLLIPGVGYLVGEAKEHGNMFKVVNSEDLKLDRDITTGRPAYMVREGEQAGDWRHLPTGSLVTKVMRQHPRHRWQPDSPTRPALPILRELVLLTQHVEATARSRLAGAGVQFFPAEASMPGGWKAFVDEWVKSVRQPIKDRASVAADVPFPVKIPGQWLQYMKDSFVTYSTPFDEHALALREEAISRLGNAMDMPRQILTGEQQNHWGNWQIEEAGLKLHVEPTLEVICEGLTVGYLTPGLDAGTENDQAVARELERQLGDEPMSEFVVWYDTSDLRVRPDRSDVAPEAYDRFQINGEALRKELGLSEAEPWNVEDEEVQTQILLTHAMSPQSPLAEVALKKLGIIDEDDLPEPPPPPPMAAPANGQAPPEQNGQGERGNRELPGTQGERPSPSSPGTPPARAAAHVSVEVPDVVPAVSPAIALVAACSLMVDRALEVAGKRVLAEMRKGPAASRPRVPDAHRCPAPRLHTCIDTVHWVPIDMQFIGAWDRLPEIAGRLGEDPEPLSEALDWYVRELVGTRAEHTWERLAEALGVCPCEAA